MVDFGKYVPPGVYVDSAATPTISTLGISPTVVCLIGTGVGYHTYSETLSFASGGTISLAKPGVDPTSIKMQGYTSDPNVAGQSLPTTFVQGASGTNTGDYYVTQKSPDNNPATVTTTISQSSSTSIEVAYPTVTVQYKYADSSYYELNQFDDLTSLATMYGPALDPLTGEIQSSLTMAATIAVQNGANTIWTLALSGQGTIQQQFADAYSTISSSNKLINIVVPLWKGVTDQAALSGMYATLDSFLQRDASSAVMRIAITGFDQNFAPTPTSLSSLAHGVNSSRIVMAWPNRLEIYNSVRSTSEVVDGYYLASAYAGIMSAQPAQMPLTKKYPRGFSGIPSAMATQLTNSTKNTLAQAGIALAELNNNNNLQVRHGLSTNFDGGPFTREISLLRQADGLYNLIQGTLESAALVGTPITAETEIGIKGVVTGALETAKINQLINDYASVQVKQQVPPSGDPTIVKVQFAYKPSYPLNYILVSFSVDTTTGTTDVTASSLTTGTS